VYTSVEVDYERVERVRMANQAGWKQEEGFSLTYLPFIVRAFCDAVRDYPSVNASATVTRSWCTTTSPWCSRWTSSTAGSSLR